MAEEPVVAVEPPATGQAAAHQTMSKAARGGGANLAGAAITAIAQFALTWVVTRGLSQERAGVFFATTSLFLILVVLTNLGANTGLVYFIARALTVERRDLVRSYLRTALRPVFVVGLLVAVALFLGADQVAGVLSSSNQDLTRRCVQVLAVFIPVASMTNLLLAATRGAGTMRPYALVELTLRPVVQLALVGGALLVAGTELSVTGWALSYLPALALAWWMWRRLARARGLHVREAAPERVSRPFWRFTWPRALTSLIQIAAQRLDILLLAALAGPIQAAVYTAATRFVVIGQLSTNAVSLATQPQLAAAVARDDRAELRSIYQISTAWLIMLNWPLYLLMACFSTRLLSIFGDDYASGGVVILTLVVAMLVSTGFGMVEVVLTMAGRTTTNLINAGVALALQVGLDLVLIPIWGVQGAAIGWATAIVARNVLALVQVRRALDLHPFGLGSLWSAGLALTCYLAVPLGVRLLLGDSWVALAVAGVTSLALSAVLAYLVRDRLHLDLLVAAFRGRRRVAAAKG